MYETPPTALTFEEEPTAPTFEEVIAKANMFKVDKYDFHGWGIPKNILHSRKRVMDFVSNTIEHHVRAKATEEVLHLRYEFNLKGTDKFWSDVYGMIASAYHENLSPDDVMWSMCAENIIGCEIGITETIDDVDTNWYLNEIKKLIPYMYKYSYIEGMKEYRHLEEAVEAVQKFLRSKELRTNDGLVKPHIITVKFAESLTTVVYRLMHEGEYLGPVNVFGTVYIDDWLATTLEMSVPNNLWAPNFFNIDMEDELRKYNDYADRIREEEEEGKALS